MDLECRLEVSDLGTGIAKVRERPTIPVCTGTGTVSVDGIKQVKNVGRKHRRDCSSSLRNESGTEIAPTSY